MDDTYGKGHRLIMVEPTFTELAAEMRAAIKDIEAATSLNEVKAALLTVLHVLEAHYAGRAREHGETT
jgi:hypothetical protein